MPKRSTSAKSTSVCSAKPKGFTSALQHLCSNLLTDIFEVRILQDYIGTQVKVRRLLIRKNIQCKERRRQEDEIHKKLHYRAGNMAKSTQSTVFRKVNVDEFDENNYQDEVVEDDQVAGPDEGEISRLLSSKKNVDALQLVLKNPPVMSKNTAVKAQAFQLVLRVLSAFKSSEIEGAVKGLDNDSIDILMKYIYRGFAEPSDGTASILLTWHEKVYAVGGVGSIIRVLTDRKSV